MENKFWNSEKLLSLSALLVSLLTLAVFIYQTNLIRKEQYMKVYPHLSLFNYGSNTLFYKYVLVNQGIGPALIKSVKVNTLDGENYKSLTGYLEDKLSEKDSIWLYDSDLVPGQLIPAEQTINLIGLFDDERIQSMELSPNTLKGSRKLRRIINSDSLKIEIEYESIYGERWVIRNDENMPIKN